MTFDELAKIDRKDWYALSMPTAGVRFDKRMLELMDSDHDGRIRIDEVMAAAAFLNSKGVDIDTASLPLAGDVKALEDVMARQADLEKVQPSDEDVKAMQAWTDAARRRM